jgi:hypothetical protein
LYGGQAKLIAREVNVKKVASHGNAVEPVPLSVDVRTDELAAQHLENNCRYSTALARTRPQPMRGRPNCRLGTKRWF